LPAATPPMPQRKPKKSDKDLFEESTMTFGEHLEALRTCLFKSVVGLVAGTAIGLYFGGSVVNFIQSPLQDALTEYYKKQSVEQVKKKLGDLESAGQDLPVSETQVSDLSQQGLLAEEIYVDPVEVLRQLKETDPQRFGHFDVPPHDPQKELSKDQLARIYIWRLLADDARTKVKTLNAQEAFTIYMKASLLVGLIIASPYIFYQIWSFVAAGLYSHERRYIHIYLPFSLGLFLTGACVAFFFVFKPVLGFLFSFNSWMGIDPDPRINEWLSFFLLLPVGFGIGFQLPLVMFFLERVGIVTIAGYVKQWRIAILAIFILAAILCPPDPYSMCMLAVPLSVLYFGGIALCKYVPRRQRMSDAGEEKAISD
jgi:sec-independent protein translocase protein TatC